MGETKMTMIKRWLFRVFIAVAAVLILFEGYAGYSQYSYRRCVAARSSDESRIKMCQRALGSPLLSPTQKWSIYSALGKLYGRLHDAPSALAYLGKAIDMAPNVWETYATRATVYASSSERAKAVSDYTAAIAPLANEVAELYCLRANEQDYLGEAGQAISDYSFAITLASKDELRAKCLTQRAIAYRRNPETWDKAMADFSEAINLNSNDSLSYRGRGTIEYLNGDFGTASEDFLAASRIDPEDRAYNLIMLFLSEMGAGKSDSAANLKERVKEMDLAEWPGPILRVLLNELSPDAVETPAVPPLWPQPLREAAARCELSYYQGELALRNGQFEEAKKLFQAAIDTGVTDYDEYHNAQFQLTRLNKESENK